MTHHLPVGRCDAGGDTPPRLRTDVLVRHKKGKVFEAVGFLILNEPHATPQRRNE